MARDINEISVAEKRGLEPLVRSRYNSVISQLRDTETRDIADLVKKIAKKFKIGAALVKIRQHKEAIDVIKKAIVDLGFELSSYDDAVTGLRQDWDRNRNNYGVDYKKPAGKVYYNLTKARPDIASVEKQRDKSVADLWLSTQKKEVKKLIEAQIDVPRLEMK